MRAIAKGAEPNSLLQHRLQQHCNYDNYAQKDDLRNALVAEQRGLCCYCMGRIRADGASMRIEHWRCQAMFPDEQLAYANLLGACRGGDGESAVGHHCDVRKADQELLWNPANPEHAIEARVRYLSDGRIESKDDVFNGQLDAVLNLNLARLRSNRKVVLDEVLNWWRSTPPARRNIQAQIVRRTDGADNLAPFSPVAVWFLRQKSGGVGA